MEARVMKVARVSARFSTLLARRRFRRSQENARSTTQRRGRSPRRPDGHDQRGRAAAGRQCGIGCIEVWLRGIGCVPLYNLMEDAATAEISRAQIWQWIRHSANLEDGRVVDAAPCRAVLEEELAKLHFKVDSRYDDAAERCSAS